MPTNFLKSLEHGFKKSVFNLARPFLKKGRQDFTYIDATKIKKVVFIRPEKLGDMIISLPVFYNLKTRYPHLELYTICSPKNIAIIREDRNLSGNFLYTKNARDDFKMLQRVRSLGMDVAVDMICDDSVTALFLSQYCSTSAWRIGVGKYKHSRYYDFNFACRTGRGLGSGEKRLNRPEDGHVLDNTLGLLTAFGMNLDDMERYVPPTIPDASREKAECFIEALPPNRGLLIGYNISAGRPSRVWPMDKNIQLINLILKEYPESYIIISCDPCERRRALDLTGKFDKLVSIVPEGLNLLDVTALISKFDILITPDTSLVHIARSFKIPVVGLYTQFGHNFELWKPYGQIGGTVISGNDYNIFDIEVSEVVKSFNEMIAMVSR